MREHDFVRLCHNPLVVGVTGAAGSGKSTVFDVFAFLSECFELGRHRRIHVGVATGDAMPGRLRDRRDAAHERAADAEDVEVHDPADLYQSD